MFILKTLVVAAGMVLKQYKQAKLLLQIKPFKLHSSPSVLVKSSVAKIFCEANNLMFILVDIPRISNDEIIAMHKSGQLKFIDRYEKIFFEEYGKEKTHE